MAKRSYFTRRITHKDKATAIKLHQLQDGRKAPKWTRKAKVKQIPDRTAIQIVKDGYK